MTSGIGSQLPIWTSPEPATCCWLWLGVQISRSNDRDDNLIRQLLIGRVVTPLPGMCCSLSGESFCWPSMPTHRLSPSWPEMSVLHRRGGAQHVTVDLSRPLFGAITRPGTYFGNPLGDQAIRFRRHLVTLGLTGRWERLFDR